MVGTFKLGLVVTHQVNGSSPFNVPDMFPPVSRGPCPQCLLVKLLRVPTRILSLFPWCVESFGPPVEFAKVLTLSQPPPAHSTLTRLLSVTISHRLSEDHQIAALFRSGTRHMVQYADEDVWTFYDQGIEDIPELDEAIGVAMGEDEGETFDYDGNLDQ